jgi:hypothetical protein
MEFGTSDENEGRSSAAQGSDAEEAIFYRARGARARQGSVGKAIALIRDRADRARERARDLGRHNI